MEPGNLLQVLINLSLNNLLNRLHRNHLEFHLHHYQEIVLLLDLLNVENEIGVKLTESYAMHPGASVSGWYFANKEARYFGVGKVDKSQVSDVSKRKNNSIEEIEKWLAPVLSYNRD